MAKKQSKKVNNVRWSDISGIMRVWGKELEVKKKTFIVYSTSIGRKDEDEETYRNVYFDVLFKKNEDPDMTDGFYIKIKSGFITLTTGKDGVNRPAIMVTDYVVCDENGDEEEE